MKLYAYIGMEENPDAIQRVGIKQGIVPAGLVPLVVMEFDRFKIQRARILNQLQAQVNASGKTIQLAEFEYVQDVLVICPTPQ